LKRNEKGREMKSSTAVISEIKSVINLLLRNLSNWKWPEDGVNMVLRRALNGKYRCYLQEDVLTAIFFEFIGLQWAIQVLKST